MGRLIITSASRRITLALRSDLSNAAANATNRSAITN